MAAVDDYERFVRECAEIDYAWYDGKLDEYLDNKLKLELERGRQLVASIGRADSTPILEGEGSQEPNAPVSGS